MGLWIWEAEEVEVGSFDWDKLYERKIKIKKNSFFKIRIFRKKDISIYELGWKTPVHRQWQSVIFQFIKYLV